MVWGVVFRVLSVPKGGSGCLGSEFRCDAVIVGVGYGVVYIDVVWWCICVLMCLVGVGEWCDWC